MFGYRRVHRLVASDELNVLSEAHVEHSISLVQNEELDVGEVEVAVLDKVLQTPRRGHQDVAAALQLVQLVADDSSAVNNDRLENRVVGELAGLVVDLDGQLASRSYDDDFGLLYGVHGASRAALFQQNVHNGNQKGSLRRSLVKELLDFIVKINK